MPRFVGNDEITNTIPGSSFQFSSVRPESLGSTEYTLVTAVVDLSGSVDHFSNDLRKMLQEIVKACKKSPRAEYLMLRVISFNNTVSEMHGFKPINDINPDDYISDMFICSGMTSLNDATFSAVGAINVYAKSLADQDFSVNGAIYIITDGFENNSTYGTTKVKSELEKAKKEEILESLVSVLIGVNCDSISLDALNNFQRDVGITQFITVPDATPGKLAKLGGFISHSISSQSQALGTGGPSQVTSLTF